MKRFLTLGFVVYILLALSLATLRGDLLALSFPFLGFLLFGFWRASQRVELDVRRHLSAERVAPEQPLQVTLSVTNLGRSLDEILIEDLLPAGLQLLDGSNRHLAALARGESRAWTYTVGGSRGYYAFPAVRVESFDAFGLVRHTDEFSLPGQLLVLPPVLRVRHIAIRPRRTRVYAGTIPARVGGPGVDFFGVRDYQPGDPSRRINWRVSARQVDDLYSNEFEQERVADVGIVLDGRERTNLFGGGHSIFDYSILAAAALADAFLTQGNRVGLLLYGKYLHWTFPAYGKIQREKILHTLAAARPGGSDIFANLGHLPTRLFPVNSQMVVISPLATDDLDTLVKLRARGYQVMVISPDPVEFEAKNLPHKKEIRQAARVVRIERELLLMRLRRAGIQILDWDVSQPFDQVVRHSLLRPPQLLRVIGNILA